MRKLIFGLLVAFCFLTIGCKKDAPLTEEQFHPGDLLIGIHSNVDLKTVFDTINKLNFKISTMHGFYFNVNSPADDLDSLLAFLNTKPYINTGTGWTASGYYYEPEKSIRILGGYFDMTIPNQSDLLKLIDSLHFIDRHSDTRYMHIKVPIGSEKFWLKEIRRISFIRWSELNTIMRIKICV